MARDRDGLPLVIAATVPRLAMQFGFGFLRFQVRRKRGVRKFRRALVQGGMSKPRAARLAQEYHEVGSLVKLLRGTILNRS